MSDKILSKFKKCLIYNNYKNKKLIKNAKKLTKNQFFYDF